MPRSPSRLPILGLLSPTLLLRRNAVAKGLFGGSRVWQVVLVIMFGRRFLRKVMGREPELVATEKMVPGQFLSIRTIDPRSERRR